MPTATTAITYRPGPGPETVRDPSGAVRAVPAGWAFLKPGDAALTRRVKASGDHWVVAEAQGRRTFTRGVWAPGATIERHRADLEVERADPGHARKLEQAAARRGRVQERYVEDFAGAVRAFLAFHHDHAELADRLARAVADHATPVGSGTVARTARIPVAERAELAVIAWMRHQTTAYDTMSIARIKGERREVRRRLAQRSRELLDRYRRAAVDPGRCPLRDALDRVAGADPAPGAELPRG